MKSHAELPLVPRKPLESYSLLPAKYDLYYFQNVLDTDYRSLR